MYLYICNETDTDDIKMSLMSKEAPGYKFPDVVIPSKSANLFVLEMQKMPEAYDKLLYTFETDGIITRGCGDYFSTTAGSYKEGYTEGRTIKDRDNQHTTFIGEALSRLFIPFYYRGEGRFVWCQFLEKHFGTYTTQVVKLEIEDTAN